MGLTLQKNSRQVPKRKEITSNKLYNDVLYCHLQVISERQDDGTRYIDKKDINYSKLGEALKISRQTISKRFAALKELELIQEQGDQFVIPTLAATDAFLVPQETLRKMVSVFNQHTIDIYIYLVNRFFATREQPFEFSITGLKEFCGLGTKSASNNYIITDILDILSKLGLIEFTMQTHGLGDGIKTSYVLTQVNLTI